MSSFEIKTLSDVEDPDGADILLIEVDPGGAGDAYRKVALDNVRKIPHGQIYANDVAGSQALAATTWTKIAQFTTNGLGSSIARDHANDVLTPAKVGRHWVAFHVAFVGVHGVTYKFAVHNNGVLQAACATQTVLNGTFGNVFAIGIVDCDPAGQDLDLRVWASEAATFGVRDIGLTAFNPFPHS